MTLNYQLFDTLLEPIFILNSSRQIIYCNEPAAVICGSTVRKLVRNQSIITDIFQFSEALEGLEKITEVTDSTPYKEVNFTTVDGNAGKVQITVQKLHETDHWITFIRDVTLEERLQKKYRAELDAKEGVIEELRKAQAELENYSRNLEKMVEERTAEIRGLNKKLKALLDSLDQGFLIFDQTGLCWEVTSKACETVLETKPAGQKIWDVLKLPLNKHDGFQKWLATLFMEMLPFEDLSPLGPSTIPHSKEAHVKLDYYPIRNAENKIEAVVLVATDITKLVQAQEEAEKEKAHANFILKMFKQKRSFLSFFEESKKLMQELSLTLQKPIETWDKDALFRNLHTLKGGSASYAVRDVAKVVHHMESMVTQLQQNPEEFNFTTWTQHAAQLKVHYEHFHEEVQQLLGPATQSKVPTIEINKPDLYKILDLLETWGKTQDWAKTLKHQYFTEPLEQSFESYNLLVQKTGEELGKKVHPILFKTPGFRWNFEPYRSFMATLVHIFRNAVDHGLETPEEREKAGKPIHGQILIEAIDHESEIELRISDDGRGLNLFRIKQRMNEMGIPLENLSPHDIAMHVFAPGLSTRVEVSELSGRGIGLDAVKVEVEKIGGSADIQFIDGQGTTFIFKLPKATYSGLIAPNKQAA